MKQEPEQDKAIETQTEDDYWKEDAERLNKMCEYGGHIDVGEGEAPELHPDGSLAELPEEADAQLVKDEEPAPEKGGPGSGPRPHQGGSNSGLHPDYAAAQSHFTSKGWKEHKPKYYDEGDERVEFNQPKDQVPSTPGRVRENPISVTFGTKSGNWILSTYGQYGNVKGNGFEKLKSTVSEFEGYQRMQLGHPPTPD